MTRMTVPDGAVLCNLINTHMCYYYYCSVVPGTIINSIINSITIS